MKRRIRYRRIRVTADLPADLQLKCVVCGSSKKVDLHHYRYAFKTSEIRKNPRLAILNTIMVCFPHHRLADAVMLTRKHPSEVREIEKAVREDSREGGGDHHANATRVRI